MTRTLALTLAAALLVGCYQSHSGRAVPDAGSPPGDGRVPPPPPPPPPPPLSEARFVIASLTLPEALGARAHGVNLDGLDSGEGSTEPDATCQEFNVDFTSIHGGEAGVDNAWSQLVPTLESLVGSTYDELLAARIADGSLLIGVRLDDGGGASLVSLSPSGPLRLDSRGRPEAGQRFEVIEELAVGSRSPDGARERMVIRGRFRIPGVEMFLPLLPIAELDRAQLTYAVGSGGLMNGELGAAVEVELAVESIASIMPGIEDTLRSVLESVADLDPGPDPQICTALSLGMAFEAVPAEF